MRRRVLGEEQASTLTSMNNQAISLSHLGEHNEAIKLMQQAARGRAATRESSIPTPGLQRRRLATRR